MIEYFEFCGSHGIVIKPQFVSYEFNTLYLTQTYIDEVHALAIGNFLFNAREVKTKKLYNLIIDECQMKDEAFANLLEGCLRQSVMKGKIIRTQYLSNISYSCNEFGPKSLEVLGKLVPQLTNIQFHNIPFVNGFNHSLLNDLLNKFTLNSNMLMKLRVSNINLCNTQAVETLCQIISNTKVLQLLNVSWARLSCQHLSMISARLIDRVLSLRSVDLSYNRLQFNQDHNADEFYFTQIFMDNLIAYLDKSILINHLKLSGMSYDQESIIKIVERIARSPLLMSIHLNDNEINRDYDFLNKILEYFNLGEDDLHECNRSKLIQNQTAQKNPKAGYTENDSIDFKTYMKKFLGFNNLDDKMDLNVR